MPKGGSSGGGVTAGAGSANRVDYAGDGSMENPFQFTFYESTPNFNAYATLYPIIYDQTEVGVRIRRIWIELDGVDATALNAIAGVLAFLNNDVGTSDTVHLTPMGAFVRAAAPYGACVQWDFVPPLVLIRYSRPEVNGHWIGDMTVQVVGYAATDDQRLYVDGEWWYL